MKYLSENHRFPTEASFIAYFVSKLGPKAYKQVAPWVKGGHVTFAEVDEMFHMLDQAYEDPQRQKNAIRELQSLRQKNRPFVEFRPISAASRAKLTSMKALSWPS